MFLLDTDHVSILQRQSQPAYSKLRARIESYPPDVFFLSVVGFQEQVLGGNAFVNRAHSSEGVLRGYEILADVLATYSVAQVLPFDRPAEDVFPPYEVKRCGSGRWTCGLRRLPSRKI